MPNVLRSGADGFTAPKAALGASEFVFLPETREDGKTDQRRMEHRLVFA